MKHHYRDIRDKLGEPSWWDEHAVPRYCAFAPYEVANIYAQQVALVEIACQNCERRFSVAFSADGLAVALDALIRSRDLHFGDPPNAGCCAAGPTMNSVPLRVVEFWRNTRALVWERDVTLEVDITPEWASEGAE